MEVVHCSRPISKHTREYKEPARLRPRVMVCYDGQSLIYGPARITFARFWPTCWCWLLKTTSWRWSILPWLISDTPVLEANAILFDGKRSALKCPVYHPNPLRHRPTEPFFSMSPMHDCSHLYRRLYTSTCLQRRPIKLRWGKLFGNRMQSFTWPAVRHSSVLP